MNSEQKDFPNTVRMPPDSLGAFKNGNRRAQTRAAQLASERDDNLPVWVRAPKRGSEFYLKIARHQQHGGQRGQPTFFCKHSKVHGL